MWRAIHVLCMTGGLIALCAPAWARNEAANIMIADELERLIGALPTDALKGEAAWNIDFNGDGDKNDFVPIWRNNGSDTADNNSGWD